MNLYEQLNTVHRYALDNTDSPLKDSVIRCLSNTLYTTNIPFDVVCHMNQIMLNSYTIDPLKIYELFKD